MKSSRVDVFMIVASLLALTVLPRALGWMVAIAVAIWGAWRLAQAVRRLLDAC